MSYPDMLRERYASTVCNKDLYKLWKNCVNLYTEMDKELVICRRMQRATPRYLELEKQLIQALEQFDQFVTFSKLLY